MTTSLFFLSIAPPVDAARSIDSHFTPGNLSGNLFVDLNVEEQEMTSGGIGMSLSIDAIVTPPDEDGIPFNTVIARDSQGVPVTDGDLIRYLSRTVGGGPTLSRR